MKNRLITSALGCLALLFLNACSTPKVEKIEISSKPVSRPELVLPKADILITRDVNWKIVTSDNATSTFETIKKDNEAPVIFGLTTKNYENLSMNINDLRAYIQQQNAIINAYRTYYIETK